MTVDSLAEGSSSSTPLCRPPLTIIYSSATGTAQDLAHRISRLGLRHHFPVDILPFDLNITPAYLSQLSTPVIFLIATAGNGSFPTISEPSWQQLLSTHLSLNSTLKAMKFAIFGLGDSSYPRFCWPERMLRKRLIDLGAEEIAEKGEGDEQHYFGIEGTFQPFLEQLMQSLDEKYPLPDNGLQVLADDAPLPPSLELRFLDEHEDGQQASSSRILNGSRQTSNGDGSSSQSTSEHSDLRWLRLSKNDRLTSDSHWQDVRLLEFEIPNDTEPDLQYEAGDIAALRPCNDSEMVDALLHRMNWSAHRNRPVALYNRQGERVTLPPTTSPDEPLTLHTYIKYHTSPFSPLRPSLFPLLRPFTPKDHIEYEKLTEFSTPGEGYEDAMEYGVKTRRTIYEVLEEFKSIQFDPRYIPEIFANGSSNDGMRQREFSIASSRVTCARKFSLVVAIVEYQTRIKEKRRGVATKWISSLELESIIPVKFKPSSLLKLPHDPSIPIIAIGPGTGMAPIRSLVHERLSQPNYGPMKIFLGCRSYPHEDALLHTEWTQLCTQYPAVQVHWASSRTDPNTGKPRPNGQKEYVQDLIIQHSNTIWELIEDGAVIYISGSSGAMPTAVRRAFENVIEKETGLDEDQAKRFVDRLESCARWREECWS
ncbi:unnamed protein product [Sympodiomycopsis kandeliae]